MILSFMAVESGTATSASKLMADGPEMCLVYCRCWNFTDVIVDRGCLANNTSGPWL